MGRRLALFAGMLVLTAAVAVAQTPAAANEALAKTPNPELVGALAKELGSTPEQATGAGGSLFSLAKTRLKPEEWTKVAGAVPGMDGLLKATPAGSSRTWSRKRFRSSRASWEKPAARTWRSCSRGC